MEETEFNRIAEATFEAMMGSLEPLDDSGALEVEFNHNILSITLHSGQQFILNKHTPTRQLWLSSPRSGGLHFSFDPATQTWIVPDGRILGEVLSSELDAIAAIKVQC